MIELLREWWQGEPGKDELDKIAKGIIIFCFAGLVFGFIAMVLTEIR